MSALDCFWCGSLWCNGDNCGGRAKSEQRAEIASLKAERDRLLARIESLSMAIARRW